MTSAGTSALASWRSRVLLAPALLLQFACGVGGCAALNPVAPPFADPGQLGRIGLVTGQGVPTYSVDGPELDLVVGGAASMLSGILECMGAVGPGAAPAAVLVCLPLWAAAVAAGSIISATPAEESAEAKRRATELVSTLQLHEVVRHAGLDQARTVGFGLQDIDPTAGPAGPDDAPTYAHLAGTLDSVLEINLQRLYPQVMSFEHDVPVYFTMDARLRVLALADLRVLDTVQLSRVTPARTADEWLAGDGARLRADLHKIAHDIAGIALEDLMVYRPPVASEPAEAREERVPGYALRPISPPIRIENPFKNIFSDAFKTMTCGEDYEGGVTYGWQQRATLPSLQPEFRWEALPRAFDRPEGDGAGELQDLRYDFRIFGKDGLAYERLGLAETFHVPDSPLDPCADFRWTVRARFRLDGVTRATEWTGAYNTIGGHVDPRSIRRHSGAVAPVSLHDDRLKYFPIVQTPAADGGPCKCR